MKPSDKNLVYYGPHPCQKCDKGGAKGTLIVKAGNGAPDSFEFDFPKNRSTNNYPEFYPNGEAGKKYTWKRHIHVGTTIDKDESAKRAQEAVEVIAQNIEALADTVNAVLSGRLQKKSLIILLAHSSGLPQTQVERVLDALKNLSKDHVK